MLASLTPPKLEDLRQIDRQHLEGDQIQPGHPLFGRISRDGTVVIVESPR